MENILITDFARWQILTGENTAFFLCKYVTCLAQWSRNDGRLQCCCPRRTVGGVHTDAVEAAIHRRTREVIKASIDQGEEITANLFLCAQFRNHDARLCNQETSWLNFHTDFMP